MKTTKVIYWTSTGIVSAMMLFSAYLYLGQSPELIANFKKLGYPLYFVLFLGVAKILGAVALLVPGYQRVKEWAYAGFSFTFIGAFWSHISTGTPFAAPLIFLVILAVSYWFREKLTKGNLA